MEKIKSAISGFTLIELMVTVAIIGIMAAVGYPSYVEHVNKARRTIAQNELMMLAQAMEDYYGKNFSYVGAVTGITLNPNLVSIYTDQIPVDSSNKLYNLTIALTASSYILTATRNPTSVMKDDACGDFTFTGEGGKGLTSNIKLVEECWD